MYPVIFATFAFVFGACVGSFLNVCIYRLPLGLSVNEPKRSFCPNCKYQIPWSSNLPLVTWVIQRGKCRNCNAPISARYVLVELLTALLFLGVWWRVSGGSESMGQWCLFIPLAAFVSLLIVATFIDFEHFIIPDEITWGGAIAGVVFSLGLPQLHGQEWGSITGHLAAAGWSVAGATLGFVVLWLVSVFGKAAFGKKTMEFPEARPFTWEIEGERAKLKIGDDEHWWDEMFTNEKDFLVMECGRFVFDGKTREKLEVRFQYERMHLDDAEHDLNTVKFFTGSVRKISHRRDAMGFGDVKFIACIGAFLGWEAVLFTVMAASVIGALVGGAVIAIGRREWSAKIPFGPYLSLGALIWMFCGPELVGWYLNTFAGPPPDAL